ncbi:MAG: ParB/RepB/Spo0J family partition protein [Clostridia bacterium]|nr:ParB/RepB/Spo0J family partition protein [Clostridia bacterium]
MAASTKRGLGTGLDALFGDEFHSEDDSNIQKLPLSKVEPREKQPRIRFDEGALAELAESIKEYGLIQPITVRKLESGYYQIIAGERRWRASRMAGLTEVPVRVIEADERLATELALVENLQREDLNPVEEARGYKTLIEEYGLTQEEAAQRVGKSRPAVTNAMRLLSLSAEVLKLVEGGIISAGHARALLAIQNPLEQLNAARMVMKKELSVRKTEELARRLSKESTAESFVPDIVSVDYLNEAAKMLEKSLGRRVKMAETGKRGRIVLEYYGADDREALINSLIKLK